MMGGHESFSRGWLNEKYMRSKKKVGSSFCFFALGNFFQMRRTDSRCTTWVKDVMTK